MKDTMFKPATGRAPKDREANARNIYDHLIATGEKAKTKKERQRRREERKFKEANPEVDTQSTRMLELTKQNILGDIFDQIDGDGDGEISSSKMNIEPLSQDLMDFFKPILW